MVVIEQNKTFNTELRNYFSLYIQCAVLLTSVVFPCPWNLSLNFFFWGGGSRCLALMSYCVEFPCRLVNLQLRQRSAVVLFLPLGTTREFHVYKKLIRTVWSETSCAISFLQFSGS